METILNLDIKPREKKKPGRKPKGEKKFVKKVIYFPPELAAYIEEIAGNKEMSFSGVVAGICREKLNL